MQGTALGAHDGRTGIAVKTFASISKTAMHLAQQASESSLAHLRQPDQTRLFVDTRTLDVADECAYRAAPIYRRMQAE
jgi:hypothetical protein